MATPPISPRRGILLAMLLLGSGLWAPVRAQETDLTFEHLSTEQGLSNYTVTSILQDRSGFLWVGTQSGLNRYDGYNFKVYLEGFISTLYEDHLGTLWVGTLGDGLFAFDPTTEQFTSYPSGAPDSLSHHEVQAIFEDQSGTVWVGTGGGGLNRLDRATGRFSWFQRDPNEPHSIASDTVWALHALDARPGILWIGTKHGLNRLAISTGRITRNPFDSTTVESPVQDQVQAIHSDQSGTLWVGTRNSGLYKVHPDTGIVTHYTLNPDDLNSLSSNYVQTIYEDREGILWIGTNDGGLNRLDRASERFRRYLHDPSMPGSLPHNEVHAVLMDRAGVLWVGTWTGLGKHNPYNKKFKLYTHQPDNPNSLSRSWVSSIYEGRDGVLWIGTQGGGLNRLDRQTNRFTPFRLPFADIIAIREDHTGSIWLGTRDNNLYHFDPRTERLTPYPLGEIENENQGDIVLTIYEAPSESGLLWIGTKLKGLYEFDISTRRVIGSYVHNPANTSSLGNDYAWPIFEDHEGTLWVGTVGGGLNRLNRETNTFTRYVHDESDSSSISHDFVFSIYEDRAETLWIGTFGGGLNRFDRATERFTHYTVEDGLPHNVIIAILGDDEGMLWVSTNNGLSRFNPQSESFTNFDVSDGLQGTSFHAGASFESSSGELFFGGQFGLNAFFPDDFTENPHVPPIVLTDFRIFDESVRLDSSISVLKEITLPYNDNFIAFDFAALDFTDPSKNQYRYILEGEDEDWVSAAGGGARYTKLDPDRYTFRVQGSNNDGVWNKEGAAVHIVIAPPWWKTWWAYTLYALLLIAGIYVVDRERRARLKDQLKAEAAEEHARVLEQLDRMKSRFFVNISHEFRTPLTLILGPLQDALDGAYGPVSARLTRQVGMMRRNSTRLLRLINQLLDLSKLESGSMHLRARRANVVLFLKRLTALFTSRAERKHITFLFEAEQEEIDLYFEPDKLEKIFINLLSNAFKFTPEHGKIRVSVAQRTRETGSFTSSVAGASPGLRSGGSYVEVAVKDTGPGIPAEEIPHIFDPFHQVDASSTREHEGTGIGLALVKELVALHGGDIDVESEVGFGSTFIVRLLLGAAHLKPDEIVEDEEAEETSGIGDYVDPDPGQPEADPDEGSDEPLPSAPVILIVEDNADVRDYLKTHLAAFYRIVEASDGVEGLERAREVMPDLVISDVMMPKMDGYELCHSLKTDERLNHIPVILLTAKVDEASQIKGLREGADDYIKKPFNAEVLTTRVENLIEIRRILQQRDIVKVVVGRSEFVVSSAEAAFLEQVQEVVEQHMGNSNFGVDWLADEVGYSVKQLGRKMKAATTLTPAGYIRKMRLERAAQLLEQRAGTVAEIAYRVGFKNADHFSRLFHTVVGVPPTKYPPE